MTNDKPEEEHNGSCKTKNMSATTFVGGIREECERFTSARAPESDHVIEPSSDGANDRRIERAIDAVACNTAESITTLSG